MDVIAGAGAEGRRDNSLLTKRSQRVLIYYLQPCQEGNLQQDSSGVCPALLSPTFTFNCLCYRAGNALIKIWSQEERGWKGSQGRTRIPNLLWK